MICLKIQEIQSKKMLMQKIEKEIRLHKHIIRGIQTQFQEYSLQQKELFSKKTQISNEMIELVHDYEIKQMNLQNLAKKIMQIYRPKITQIDQLRLELIQFEVNHKYIQFGQKISIRKCILAFFQQIQHKESQFLCGVQLEISRLNKCLDFQFFIDDYVHKICQNEAGFSQIFIPHMKQYIKILKKGEEYFKKQQHQQDHQYQCQNTQNLIFQFKSIKKQLKQLQSCLQQKSKQQQNLNKTILITKQKQSIKQQLIEQQQNIRKQLKNKIKQLKNHIKIQDQYRKQLNQMQQALEYIRLKFRQSQNVDFNYPKENQIELDFDLKDRASFNEQKIFFNRFKVNNGLLDQFVSRRGIQHFSNIDISQIRSSNSNLKSCKMINLMSPNRQKRRTKNRLGSPSPWK